MAINSKFYEEIEFFMINMSLLNELSKIDNSIKNKK